MSRAGYRRIVRRAAHRRIVRRAGLLSGFALGLCVAATGCGADAASNAPVEAVVRDSAGVRIVENPAPPLDEQPVWRVETEPSLTIGGDGSGEELHRVDGAIQLGGGGIVVAHAGAYELRFYDASGVFRNAVGRRGAGPGEFQVVRDVFRMPGDSVLVWDDRLHRGSIFDSESRFGRLVSVDSSPFGYRGPFVVDVLADGSMLMTGGLPGGGARLDELRYYTGVLIASSEGEPLADLGAIPEGTCGSPQRCTVPMFTPYRVTAAGPASVFYGFGDRYQLSEVDTDGRLRTIIRYAKDPLPITDADIAHLKQASLKAAPADRRAAVERAFATDPVPAAMPAMRALLVDTDANLWVEESTEVEPIVAPVPLPRAAGESEPGPRWTVFASDGLRIGTVSTPADLIVTEIGDDYVLGIHSDELGVQTVRLYRLIRDVLTPRR